MFSTLTHKMMKKLLLAALFATLSITLYAQETVKLSSKGRPNIPGTIQIDLGLNRMANKPNNLKYGFIGSRTLNLYYFHDVRIGKSKFSVHPGIGFSFERFKLLRYSKTVRIAGKDSVLVRNTPTLFSKNADETFFTEASKLVYAPVDSLFGIKKSMIVANYLDIPLEFRFSTNPQDPSRSFKVSIGGRVGILMDAHTKLKYSEDGIMKKVKYNENFNLNPIRYSATLRIGIGNFNWFAHYNFSPLFQTDKGPSKTTANTYTVGISLSGF